MKIVAHHGARLFGGAERAVARLLAGLQARGHDVLLLYNDPVVAAGARALGVPVEHQPLGGDVAIPDALRLSRALRRHHPDAFLITLFKKAWLGALAGRLAGVPRVVLRTALSSDVARSAKYRLALHWIDAVVLNSPSMRPAFLASAPAYSPERVRVIAGAVTAPARQRGNGAVREDLGIPAGVPVVGTVARLATQKRLDRLLRALALLPSHVQAVIAGDGAEGGRLRALAEELAVAERVRFLGHREDVGDVLSALDVFVLCSDSEGLSNAMLEALAAGVPVVSTPVSGAAEALAPLGDLGAPGEVVGFDPRDLATALAGLLADPERRRRASLAAQGRAQESFGFERMLDDWEAVLAGRGP